MASITVLGKGKDKRYKVCYELPRIGGERQRKSKTFPKGTPKAVVDEFKRQMEIALAVGDFTSNENITVSEFIETVYFPIYTKQLSVTTLEGYRHLYENSKPYCIKKKFGKYKVKEVTRRMVQEYANELSDNVSPKTVRSYTMWLHTIFDYAISEEIIKPTKNPCTHLKLPTKKKKKIEAYTVEELQIMFNESKDDLLLQTIIGLGALAGLRRGEMCGLRWKDVDYMSQTPTIQVNETLVVVEKEQTIKDPKTAAGNREIPIPQMLADILRKQHLEYMRCRMKYGTSFGNCDRVIFREDGYEYKPDSVCNKFQRYIERLNKAGYDIPFRSLHKLRHTYATMLINSGANVKVVQANMGHEDVAMTLGIYSHAYKDRQREDVDKLNDILLEASNVG